MPLPDLLPGLLILGLDKTSRRIYSYRYMKQPELLVAAFKALGDPTRLKILELLKARGKSCCDLISRDERGLCACDIEAAVGLSQAAVSHHMDVLRRGGLVEAEKRGRWMFYRRNEAALACLAESVAKAV
jgi:ArsR family transcriptional regulator